MIYFYHCYYYNYKLIHSLLLEAINDIMFLPKKKETGCF